MNGEDVLLCSYPHFPPTVVDLKNSANLRNQQKNLHPQFTHHQPLTPAAKDFLKKFGPKSILASMYK
jgi:hypothetical protein